MLFYSKPLKYVHAVFRFDDFINECCIFLSMYDRNSNETSNEFTRRFIKYLKTRAYNYIRVIYSFICFLFPIKINRGFRFFSIVLQCFRYMFRYSFTLFSQRGFGNTIKPCSQEHSRWNFNDAIRKTIYYYRCSE
jgi:hypothetical protein